MFTMYSLVCSIFVCHNYDGQSAGMRRDWRMLVGWSGSPLIKASFLPGFFLFCFFSRLM